jgi:3-keto-5-aminohexanoate cleavage enzyme
MLTFVIIKGGHVRLGTQDIPYYADGVPAKSNAQLVERIVRIATELGREIATPDDTRNMLGLPQRPKNQ